MDRDRSDIVLWKKLKRSDKCAFAMLYERHVGMLYNYASKMCKDKVWIEDCIQDLFIDLWRYRRNLADTTSVKFYLYHSLRCRLFKSSSNTLWTFRDGVNWEDVERLMSLSPEDDRIEAESVDELTRKLQKFLHNLSPRQYEAIVLRFYDGFSYEEIASIMQVNSQSIRNLIQRGLVQLRQYAQYLISAGIFLTCLAEAGK